LRKTSALILALLVAPALADDRHEFIKRITADINKSGTGFRVADVIWDLPARYGTSSTRTRTVRPTPSS